MVVGDATHETLRQIAGFIYLADIRNRDPASVLFSFATLALGTRKVLNFKIKSTLAIIGT